MAATLTSDSASSMATGASSAARADTSRPDLAATLERAFGESFALVDGPTGDLLMAASGQPARNWSLAAEVCRQVARRGRPEFIDDEDPLLTLALPLRDAEGHSVVAVATFVTRRVERLEEVAASAKALEMNSDAAFAWARWQTPWTAEQLDRTAELVLENARTDRKVVELREEADALSVHLASTYEEISLLYRLTQNLKLSATDEDLGRIALEWMEEVVPAAGLVLQLAPTARVDAGVDHEARTEPLLITRGECPLDNERFSQLMAHVGRSPRNQPTVLNHAATEGPDWPCPEVRQLIAAPLAEGENVFGWLAALNHVRGGEFGSVEANLLQSVAAILGIHGGNISLYRQQSEMLAGVVRALTSAIDAKDPYTCGHSDRVARVAVRLAQELGCDAKMLNTLYLAGMLHDIGKIGVNDNVLRKEGKLSDDEYRHIKQHVDIGHRILHDLAKLEDVLPVVLYHHESWDGRGYPHRLGATDIPLSARIVAVADAFDAMSSDRPYRKGMPDEKVDSVLRSGAGQQWDPDVIEAFFRARNDIRQICREEAGPAKVLAATAT